MLEVSTPKSVKHSKIEPPIKRVKVEHPEYSVYVDSELRAVAKSGKMSTVLKQRLVRSTIVNMTAAAASEPFCRYPLTAEIEEMAKSLIVVYPCLRDPETGHVSIISKLVQNSLSGIFLKQAIFSFYYVIKKKLTHFLYTIILKNYIMVLKVS